MIDPLSRGSNSSGYINNASLSGVSSKARSLLHSLGSQLTAVANGSLHQKGSSAALEVAETVLALHSQTGLLQSCGDTSAEELSVNTTSILTQPFSIGSKESSLLEAAQKYNEGNQKELEDVLSSFFMHRHTTEMLGRELHLLANLH